MLAEKCAEVHKKSLKTCYVPMPLIVPNYFALAQTMYEKSVTIFTPFCIFAPQGNLRQSSPISALTDSKDRTTNVPHYVSFWQPVYETCQCQSMSISIKIFRWLEYSDWKWASTDGCEPEWWNKICCRTSLISLKAWQKDVTDKDSKRHVSAYHAATKIMTKCVFIREADNTHMTRPGRD